MTARAPRHPSLLAVQLLGILAIALGLAACGVRLGSGGGGGGGELGGGDGDDDGQVAGDDDDGPSGGGNPYGPENSWWHAETDDIPDDLSGTGFRTGDRAHDFTLTDQNGDPVQLYQFFGKVIVLDVYAQWCGPCQDNAPHGQALWEEGGGEVILIAATQQD